MAPWSSSDLGLDYFMRALIEVQQPATGPAWMVKVKIQEVVSNMVNLWHIHNYTKNIWIKTYEKQMWG
jgi:hypothetical protein